MSTTADGSAGSNLAAPFSVTRNGAGKLELTDARGNVHVGVEPIRSFPISDPDCCISLVDSHGKEVASIPRLLDLPPTQRELIGRELADREFLPKIERVVRVVMHKEPNEWHVITDRGPVHFLLRDADDIRRLSPTRAIIVDMHGVRYYVPDSRQLDAKSRRILSQYL
jgi:hypothetical protein